jgi:effector-binding domain-containing protein
MLETPEIVETQAQPAAIIRLTVPRDQIREVMGPGLQEVMAALAEQSVSPAGPWYTRHLRMDPEVFDFEIGIPVATPILALGRVEPGELRATRVARAIYHGDYEGLGPAWSELDAWVTAAGHRSAPDLWERYVAGPEASADPANWRTELNRPLLD